LFDGAQLVVPFKGKGSKITHWNPVFVTSYAADFTGKRKSKTEAPALCSKKQKGTHVLSFMLEIISNNFRLLRFSN